MLRSIVLIAQASLALCLVTRDPLTDCLRAASVPIASALPTAYNLRLPYKPVAVAIPTTVNQISSAVSCGAKNGVSVSAKSGGHDYVSSGFGGEDGHLVISLDRMYAVTVASDGTAKVQAGARLGHVATELYKQGKRAISHGTCPGVGIGGHALHGGHGMVSRKYGLATDWIKGATVVLANGTVTRCSATERPNLFWGIRGAGASLAIVAEIEFKTFAAPEKLTYFDIELPWDVKKVPQVLVDAQDFAKGMPAELTMSAKFNNGGYYLHGAYIGDESALRIAIQPLLTKLSAKATGVKTVGWIDSVKHFAGVTEIDITTPTYNEAQLEPFVNAIAKDGFTTSRTWFVHMNLHGGSFSAITKPKTNDTAYVHRDRFLLFQLNDGVPQSQQYPANGFAFLQGFRQSITQSLSSNSWGMYVNYPDSEVSASDAPRLYWGSNLGRLEWLKEDYDPGNILRSTQSIKPAD